jgi:LysR family transcriptional regulator for metE and metH
VKLETRSLELVLAIADHGTMTRAARHIHLTQSALSHHLLQLEARLQVQLFHRMGRRMLPTPAGQRLVDLARRVIPEVAAAEEQMESEAAGRTAVLRLSTECYTTYTWLPRVLPAFRRRHAGVEVRIVAEATSAPLDALRDRQIDLAIVHSDVLHSGVRTVPLFTDEMVLVTAPDHPLAARRHVAAAALQPEHLILYAVGPDEVSVAREFLATEGVMPRRLSSVPLTEAIIEMVKAGLGVTILSRWAVRSHASAGSVATIRLGRDGLYREWKAAVLQDQPPAYLRDFIELLAQGPDLIRDDAVSA